ncbi:16S rRNA (adenine(1518)-N(6)/adenine(1519)-N(6))-dimethyltransferase RsmA [Thermosulfurimonas sp.]|uniref:16S rRNA (adenine(1518)-N(6)/adenine(1519)-N(6))- dimethyltransferase RsmA n=1 Tax=Thermosulfurimonas sp. TaxID=2080236 RepID=UPI0025F0B0A5|nr:16S rRNA (adenine(1518)-N(6)/adenine(1519)-N(6))-dimethyltransferase RsmA [Thermosulfurimonas sp.]
MPAVNSPAILSEPPTPAELLRRHGIRARKRWGQHFLARPETALRLVEAAGVPVQGPVVELGAGLGTLTWALARVYPRVIAYELDPRLLEILQQEKFLPPWVELRPGDILRLDYRSLRNELGAPLVVFGNLPYYLSGRLLFRFYQEHRLFSVGVFMFQREVVERLLASPGGRHYGVLSVLTGLLTEARRLMVLKPGAFYPPPEVSSAVVRLVFRPRSLPATLWRVLKVAFSRRRKKLLRNLSTLWPEEILREIFRELGIPEKVRAEELSPEEFLELARRLEGRHPVEEAKEQAPG